MIRPAALPDLPAITAIYNHAILHTTATFDTEPKTEAEQTAWFSAHGERHPILVATVDGRVVGWASLSAWSDRCAYSDTAEVFTYVDANHRGQGIGKALAQAIDREAQRLGFPTLIARIVQGNATSIGMCQALGYVQTGVMREVGLKSGQRLDVIILQRFLGGPANQPVDQSISAIKEVCQALTTGAVEEARTLAKRHLPFEPVTPGS